MKRSCQIFGIISLLSAFMLFFTACPPVDPGTPGNSPPPGTTPPPVVITSAGAMEAGIQSLKDGEWEQALNNLSQSVALDPANGEAQLLYEPCCHCRG